jgi:NUMOD4 motif
MSAQMPEEIWRDIPGFEDHYRISSHGQVMSLPRIVAVSGQVPRRIRGRILSPAVRASDGRRQYFLCKHGKMHGRTAYELMLEAGFLR